MAKFINTDDFFKSILRSDVGEWRSEFPQEGTIQTGRYTYEALVSDTHTKFLIYICPEPLVEDKTRYLVNLKVMQEVGWWMSIETQKYEVHLSGEHTMFESWPQTDDEILTKIADIASNARHAHRESSTLN